VNSCGKTSLLKAAGLSLIMAQAGLFVPCESMEFSIFKRIMTRIAGGDNMEKSQR
jgi:DNA mismatch repair protein MutS